MPWLPCRRCVPLLWSLCAALLPAQDDGGRRARVFGTVTDRSGKPAPATVLLLSRPFSGRAEPGAPDLVRVAADAQGHFGAALLRGRPYTAWAELTGPGGGITTVQEDVVPGVPVALAEDVRRMPLRVAVSGLTAWGEAPVQVRAWSRTANVQVVPVPLAADGSGPLPWLPGTACDLEVVAADGTVLVSRYTPLTVAEREAELDRLQRQAPVAVGPASLPAAPGDASLPDWRLDTVHVIVPVPRTLAVRVLAGDRPVADALVQQRSALVPVARAQATGGVRTGADGSCTLAVPSGIGPAGNQLTVAPTVLVVQAPGLATTEHRFQLKAGERGPQAVTVRMAPGTEVRGRLLARGGAPLAGVPLVCEAPASLGAAGVGAALLQPVTTDAAGRFVLAGLPAGVACRLFAAADPAAPGPRDLCPAQWLLALTSPADGVQDVGDVALGALRTVEVLVRSHDGAPVACPHLLVIEADPRGRPNQRPFEATADRSGRLVLDLPRSALVLAATAERLGFVALELPALAAEPAPAAGPITLTLARPVVITGKVLTPGGQPVRDAQVSAAQTSVHPDPMRARLLNRLRPAPVRTGVDGGFRLVLPVPDQTWQLQASVLLDGQRYDGRPVSAEAGSEGVEGLDLELELPESRR